MHVLLGSRRSAAGPATAGRSGVPAARPGQGGPRGQRDPGRRRFRRLPRRSRSSWSSSSTSSCSPASFGAIGDSRPAAWRLRHPAAVPLVILFVVSGFVLFLPTAARGGDFGDVGAYALRRAARLIPAYYWLCLRRDAAARGGPDRSRRGAGARRDAAARDDAPDAGAAVRRRLRARLRRRRRRSGRSRSRSASTSCCR